MMNIMLARTAAVDVLAKGNSAMSAAWALACSGMATTSRAQMARRMTSLAGCDGLMFMVKPFEYRWVLGQRRN